MPDFYQYDHADGNWYQQGVPNPQPTPLESLTRGRYTVVADQIYDTLSTDPIRADLPATEKHVLTVDEQGNWWLNSYTDPSQINTMTKGHISWKGVANGKVRLPDGQTVDVTNQVFAITKFNRQLWVKDVPQPRRQDFIHVDVDRQTGQPKGDQRIPQGFRPATADEAATYGIAGLLAARHSRAIQALIDRARSAKKG